MYTLLHHVGIRRALLSEAPALTVSITLAELFYQFHSFTLECLALLVTWMVVSYLFSLVRGIWQARRNLQA